MYDETKKEYELFLNSKEIQPPKEISEKVLKNAKAHFSKPTTKLRAIYFKLKNRLKSLFSQQEK